MIAIATVPAIVAVVGALVYALSGNAKAAELGRIAYWCGLLVVMYVLAGHVVRLG